MAFYLAWETTQVKESISWVRCASGNVWLNTYLIASVRIHCYCCPTPFLLQPSKVRRLVAPSSFCETSNSLSNKINPPKALEAPLWWKYNPQMQKNKSRRCPAESSNPPATKLTVLEKVAHLKMARLPLCEYRHWKEPLLYFEELCKHVKIKFFVKSQVFCLLKTLHFIQRPEAPPSKSNLKSALGQQ